jgi:hypothetical protein
MIQMACKCATYSDRYGILAVKISTNNLHLTQVILLCPWFYAYFCFWFHYYVIIISNGVCVPAAVSLSHNCFTHEQITVM